MSSHNNSDTTGRYVGFAIIILCLVVVGFFVWHNYGHREYTPIKQEGNMKLTSDSFADGQAVPKIYSCQGKAINPPLSISDVPEDAKSLVLIMHDPDAPIGDFTHWLMWNIPTDTKQIAANSVPAKAMQGVNDFHKIGYGSSCPPSGTHRYYFDLYALDTTIKLTETTQRAGLQGAIKNHIIAQTSLMGTFSK